MLSALTYPVNGSLGPMATQVGMVLRVVVRRTATTSAV
ncbi:Uncharacterised protein [Mycobacterium tuberculosis]|nr:Uncharacterised protein [Mycobacterium tuberculosis]